MTRARGSAYGRGYGVRGSGMGSELGSILGSAKGQRLAKRITKFRRELFVFLDVDEVLPHNNPAELMVRPAVLMRKTSYGNRSERGRRAQQIFMSLIRTLKLRGEDFIRFAAKLAAWDPRAGPLDLPKRQLTTAS